MKKKQKKVLTSEEPRVPLNGKAKKTKNTVVFFVFTYFAMLIATYVFSLEVMETEVYMLVSTGIGVLVVLAAVNQLQNWIVKKTPKSLRILVVYPLIPFLLVALGATPFLMMW